jgi:hypothetical protein
MVIKEEFWEGVKRSMNAGRRGHTGFVLDSLGEVLCHFESPRIWFELMAHGG